MLAGQPPFPEGTVLQKLLQHQGDEPPDILEFRPELPDESSRRVAEDDGQGSRASLREPGRFGCRFALAGRGDWPAADESDEPDLAGAAGGAAFVFPASLAVAGPRGRVGWYCRATELHLVAFAARRSIAAAAGRRSDALRPKKLARRQVLRRVWKRKNGSAGHCGTPVGRRQREQQGRTSSRTGPSRSGLRRRLPCRPPAAEARRPRA